MAITDYESLQAAVATWLNRDDMSDVIPDLIAMAEASMVAADPATGKKLRVRQMVARATSQAMSAYEPLPSDFLDLIAISAPVASRIVGSQLLFDPAPSAESPINVEITYYQAIPPLALNDTNWVLAGFPNAYLFGALVQSSSFFGDSSRDAAWLNQYRLAMAAIRASDARRAPTPLVVDSALLRGVHRHF